ncbi:MAG: site-specific integrase, partial [Burkholderiales bacterium]|nr:site-specific integrase [Burkholderiales bacterium]
MARLELINFRPWTTMAGSDGTVVWQIDAQRRVAAGLPQIFWSHGAGWPEVNLWALDRTTVERSKPATVLSAMGHLKAYADFLETSGLDWRHFPMRRDERVLDRFRGHLMEAVARGQLALSTASVRMNAVVRFYRFADLHGLVGTAAPMWQERMVVLPFFDAVGFQRTMARVTTSLSIPNRSRVGTALEDGLHPLSNQATSELLSLTSQEASPELHLMLSIGFFTGARIGTIVSLTKGCLQTARQDPLIPGFLLLPVGPGTNVS